MTVADDLARVRDAVATLMLPDYEALAALDRVEAEIARLEDADAAIEAAEASVRKHERHIDTLIDRADAAEAEAARLRAVIRDEEMEARYAARAETEAARLRDGLRDAVDVATWLTGATDLTDVPAWPEMREKLNEARALLAEDGAASTCVESEDCENEWHYWRCPKHPDYDGAA